MQQCALYIKEYCFWAARDAEQRVWAEQNLVKKAAAPAVGKVAGTEAAAALWGWKRRGYYRLFLACMKCGGAVFRFPLQKAVRSIPTCLLGQGQVPAGNRDRFVGRRPALLWYSGVLNRPFC